MRRLKTTAVVALLVLAAVEPWLASVGSARTEAQPSDQLGISVPAFSEPWERTATAVTAPSGCGCQTVEIDLVNVVRDAKIETGEARAKNIAVVYVAEGYVSAGGVDIVIQQLAQAESGDAIAGQIIGSQNTSGSGGCKNVIVRASNLVENSELETGDARATNIGIVLVDPGVDADLVRVDWRQAAVAKVGDAVAGQVIGVLNEGDDGCGSVTIDATSIVRDVEIETGRARISNQQIFQVCGAVGCRAELLARARKPDAARLCLATGCSVWTFDQIRAEWTPTPPPPQPTEAPVPTEAVPGPDPTPSDA